MRKQNSNPHPVCLAVAALIAAVCFSGPVVRAQSVSAVSPNEKNLSTLQFEFQVFLAELDKPLRALGIQYTAQLRKLEAGYAENGNSKAAGIVGEEIRSFESGEVEIPRTLAEMRRLRGIYESERLPLVRVRNRKSLPLFEGYRGNLLALRNSLISSGNWSEAERITAELGAVDKHRARLMAAGIPGSRPNDSLAPLFADDFAGGQFREEWVVRNGNPIVADGRVRTADNETEIELRIDFRPNEGFRIEFDVEKQGENHHSEWDFELVVGELKGRLRFDSGDEDQLSLIGPDVVSQDSLDPDSPNRGKAVLICQNGKARFQFENSRGRVLRSDWIPVTLPDQAVIRFRLAGGGEDSPRLIDSVRVFPGGDADAGGKKLSFFRGGRRVP